MAGNFALLCLSPTTDVSLPPEVGYSLRNPVELLGSALPKTQD